MENEKFISENKFGVKTYARLTDEIVIVKSVAYDSNEVVNIDRIPLGEMLFHQNIMNALNPPKSTLNETQQTVNMLETVIANIKSQLDQCEIQAKNNPSQYKDGVVDGLNKALISLEKLKE